MSTEKNQNYDNEVQNEEPEINVEPKSSEERVKNETSEEKFVVKSKVNVENCAIISTASGSKAEEKCEEPKHVTPTGAIRKLFALKETVKKFKDGKIEGSVVDGTPCGSKAEGNHEERKQVSSTGAIKKIIAPKETSKNRKNEEITEYSIEGTANGSQVEGNREDRKQIASTGAIKKIIAPKETNNRKNEENKESANEGIASTSKEEGKREEPKGVKHTGAIKKIIVPKETTKNRKNGENVTEEEKYKQYVEEYITYNRVRELRRILEELRMPRQVPGALYDEMGIHIATGVDLCDCLLLECPGCFLPCSKCGSRKCGPVCRVFRTFMYDEVEWGLEIRKNPLSGL